MWESVPTYPDASRYWQVVDDLGVTIFYTAPTALRAIQRFGGDPVKKHSRKSVFGMVLSWRDPQAVSTSANPMGGAGRKTLPLVPGVRCRSSAASSRPRPLTHGLAVATLNRRGLRELRRRARRSVEVSGRG
jgi:hypothetical protein